MAPLAALVLALVASRPAAAATSRDALLAAFLTGGSPPASVEAQDQQRLQAVRSVQRGARDGEDRAAFDGRVREVAALFGPGSAPPKPVVDAYFARGGAAAAAAVSRPALTADQVKQVYTRLERDRSPFGRSPVLEGVEAAAEAQRRGEPPPLPTAVPPAAQPARNFVSDLALREHLDIDRKIDAINADRAAACEAGTAGCWGLPYLAASGRVVQASWDAVLAAGSVVDDPKGAAYDMTVGALKRQNEDLNRAFDGCRGELTAAACGNYAWTVGVAAVTFNPFDWWAGAGRGLVRSGVESASRLAETKLPLLRNGYLDMDVAQGIRQLSASELERRRLSFAGGRAATAEGRLSPGDYLYVMDKDLNIAVIRNGNDVKHSTLAVPDRVVRDDIAVAGGVPGVETVKQARGAGHLCVDRAGRIVGINGNSGHFRPSREHLQLVIDRLGEMGAKVPASGVDWQVGSTLPVKGC